MLGGFAVLAETPTNESRWPVRDDGESKSKMIGWLHQSCHAEFCPSLSYNTIDCCVIVNDAIRRSAGCCCCPSAATA